VLEALDPGKVQQGALNNARKRTADGLHAELMGLPTVSHWDTKKKEHLDLFFERMKAFAEGRAGDAGAPKRPRMAFEPAARSAQFTLGQTKAPASNGGAFPAPGSTAANR
jgi:hypothetical protein